jgi:phosphonate transport system substrate-binding protein
MKKLVFLVICGVFLYSLFQGNLEAADLDRPLNMVFVPASEKSDASGFKSLMDIVTKLTGIKFKFIRVTDYNAAVEAMRAGRADVAWFGAATYVIAAELADAEAFAAGIPKGQKNAGYYTYFVVRKESPIKTLADAKEKTLALNHIGSTSGDYIPQVELLKVDLDVNKKGDFKRVIYAGSHDASLLAMINKQADICAMASHNLKGRIADKTVSGDEVRIVHTSSIIPPAPLAYSKKLPEKIRKKIKAAVLEAHKHGKIGGWGGEIEKYVSIEDKDFNLMRDVREIVEKAQEKR